MLRRQTQKESEGRLKIWAGGGRCGGTAWCPWGAEMELSTQERCLSCTGRVLPTLRWAGRGGEGGHGCRCLMRCSGRINRRTSLQKICCSGSRWMCAQSFSHVLCDPMDSSPPGSSVHGILQARILEQVAISSSRGPSRPRDRICISCLVVGHVRWRKHHVGRGVCREHYKWWSAAESFGERRLSQEAWRTTGHGWVPSWGWARVPQSIGLGGCVFLPIRAEEWLQRGEMVRLG